MFEISVKTHFSGAHHLREYPGECARVHGHNWEVEVMIRGPQPDALGMLIDFKIVKAAIRDQVAELDHVDLNALPAFAQQNPTSENLARYLFEQLRKHLDSPQYRIYKVRVSESPGSTASYWE